MSDLRTSEQVISGGYHRPVCKKCGIEMHPETNGVGVLDLNKNGAYELWNADLWKCSKCGIEVVGGFGHGPIISHFEDGFQEYIDRYKKRGTLIENKER